MGKMREEFEKWARKAGFNMKPAPEPYCYDSPSTAIAWQVWQASRKALVVELPSLFSDRYESEICFTDDVERALDKAGVAYK